MSGAWLRAVYPRGLDAVVTLGENKTIIGRDLVNDRTVSRRHVVIEHDGRRHRLLDLGSHEGTRVDGNPAATWEPLASGAIVRLGEVLLVYEIGEQPPAYRTGAFPGYALATELLRERIERAAMDPDPVLLIGEAGTGKAWIARELHRTGGRTGPFVTVNCATTDPSGFLGAAAGGTLFLDEIAELPSELQPALLRALQESTVDVRVIAATRRDLAEADLYARLAREVRVPALRERRADILDWVDRLHHFWTCARGVTTALDLDPDAAEAILLAPHRENLRGLSRLVHELRGGTITRSHLPAWFAPPARSRDRQISRRVQAYEVRKR